MSPPLPTEERLDLLDARMTALEQLPVRMDRLEIRMDRLEVQMVGTREELVARLDDTRREMRVLHEDALGRIAVIGEGLTTLSQRVDYQFIQLTGFIDASLTEMREMLTTILTRFDTPPNRG